MIALGTNWIVTTAQIRQALRILGPGRVLVLVVPRELASVRTSNRRNIRAAGRRWPQRVRVLDWVRYSSGHASWFAGDGLHLTASGARGFTFTSPVRMPTSAIPNCRQKSAYFWLESAFSGVV